VCEFFNGQSPVLGFPGVKERRQGFSARLARGGLGRPRRQRLTGCAAADRTASPRSDSNETLILSTFIS